METLSILILGMMFCLTFRERKSTKLSHLEYNLKLLRRGIVIFPFALLFWALDVQEPRGLVALFSLLRLANPVPLNLLFNYLTKRYMNSVNLVRIGQVLFFYLTIAHLVACMWIEVTNIEGDD